MHVRWGWERAGAELEDEAVPSAEYDVFVLTRHNSSAAADGGCCPTAAVTFREPGKTPFQLQLPLGSSLKDVEAALESASRSPRGQASRTTEHHQPPEKGAGEPRRCTLIIGGKKMSTSFLLGDYLLMASSAAVAGKKKTTLLRTRRRREAPILVLWQPLRRGALSQGATVANACHPQRPSRLPVGSFAAAASAPHPLGSRDEKAWRSAWRPRRSVPRRCKSAARFSGLKRGARCGMGIRRQSGDGVGWLGQ